MSDANHETGRHWSKDFVEHLRTVHFTLIAVCIAVIVLASTRNQSEVSRAREQLKQIMDATANWDTQILRRLGPTPAVTKGYRITFNRNGEPHSLLLDPVVVLFDSTRVSSLAPDFLKGNEIRPPRSVAEFMQIWDLFRHGEFFATMGMPTNCFVEVVRESGDSTLALPCQSAHNEEARDDIDFDLGPLDLSAGERITLVRKGYVDKDASFTTFHEISSLTGLFRDSPVLLGIRSIRLHVGVRGSRADPVPLLLAMNPHWHRGAFEDSFQELASISAEYMTVDFDKADRILAAEEKRSGESFDAFGVKFPAESAIRWGAGAAVILIVQLYFWAHLFEFRRKLNSADEGWSVAWVGVYETRPARILLFGSLVIFPLAGILAVGIRGLYITGFRGYSWFLLIGTSIATLLLSILLCIALPRKKDIIEDVEKGQSAAAS